MRLCLQLGLDLSYDVRIWICLQLGSWLSVCEGEGYDEGVRYMGQVIVWIRCLGLG